MRHKDKRDTKPTAETWRRYCAACELSRFLGIDSAAAPLGSSEDVDEHKWRGLYTENVLRDRIEGLEQGIENHG